MEWHLNDLSLEEQVRDTEGLKTRIQSLISLRLQRIDIGRMVYCSRRLLDTPLMGYTTVRQVIEATGDKEFIRSALRWFANAGPFWDDSRQGAVDDLFYWKNKEVQETGLGEAARRRLAGTDARAFSFVSVESEFDLDPLSITHGLLEEQPMRFVTVLNARSVEELKQLPRPSLKSWSDVVATASSQHTYIAIAKHVSNDLRPRPFNAAVAHKLVDLIGILNKLSEATDDMGKLSTAGQEIYQKFFVGKEAPFSSEDPDDENTFKFFDLEGHEKIECPWHGKINIGDPFRFHFEWPRPKGQRFVKILYMGQKLTKS